MSFLINNAIAATTTTAAQTPADGSFSIIMMVGIFVLFYFMLIRPQNKRAKEHKNLINQIKVGDEIITSGGILAKVTNVTEQYLKVNITDGVDVNIQRAAVSTVLPKGTLKEI